MSQNQILLSRGPNSWLATFTGPATAHVVELFNSATLPTAFTLEASEETVREAIQSLNPAYDVVVLSGVQQ